MTRTAHKSELLRIGESRAARKRPRVLRLTSPTADNVEPPERQSQAAVIQWANLACKQWDDLRFLFAVPNGGKRDAVTASLLQKTGAKAGVPDLILPVARDGYVGLAMEMKVKGRKPTELQEAWLNGLTLLGWRAVVCYSASEAIEILRGYVSAPKTYFAKHFEAVPF